MIFQAPICQPLEGRGQNVQLESLANRRHFHSTPQKLRQNPHGDRPQSQLGFISLLFVVACELVFEPVTFRCNLSDVETEFFGCKPSFGHPGLAN